MDILIAESRYLHFFYTVFKSTAFGMLVLSKFPLTTVTVLAIILLNLKSKGAFPWNDLGQDQ